MQKSKKIVIACVALLVVLAVGLTCAWAFTKKDVQAGAKTVTIDIVHDETNTKTYTVETDAEFLVDALKSAVEVEGEEGDFGLFIYAIDGDTADAAANEYWLFEYADGTQVETGVSMTPIADGEHYVFYKMTF